MKKILSILLLLTAAIAWGQSKKPYAVVDVSAAYLRAKPDYESPLETQALMGSVMEVLDSSSYWLKVRLLEPDYTAWVNRLQVTRMDQRELQEYRRLEKVVCGPRYAQVYAEASDKGPVICDLVRGDVLVLVRGRLAARKHGFRRVALPSGQFGWVKNCALLAPKDLQGTAQSVVDEALSYLGTPYLWGGSCVKGFDCSGLVRQCYFMAGILLPRNASEQLRCGDPVDVSRVLSGDFSTLAPGDLLFFGNHETGRVSHVAIYAGDGHIVHSSMVVRYNSLLKEAPDYYENAWRLLYGRRIFCDNPSMKGITSLRDYPYYADR